MGARIIGFILYLTLSYGVIYFLIGPKRLLRGWNPSEPLISAAIIGAIVVIVGIGAMLVGPLPMVLLVIALVAFIAYVRTSETLPAGGMPGSQMFVLLVRALGPMSKQALAAALTFGARCARHPAVADARRTLEAQVSRFAGSIQTRAGKPDSTAVGSSAGHPAFATARHALAQGVARIGKLTRTEGRKQGTAPEKANDDGSGPGLVAPAPIGHETPSSLIHAREIAGGASSAATHGLDIDRAAPAPRKEAERRPTPDEARRLLDHLEGRG
jgi:hypothetical protein